MYGQRILSGISGMLLTVNAYRPDLVWAPVSKLQWSFDAPLFEGAGIDVQGRHTAEDYSITGSVAGETVSRGVVQLGKPTVPPKVSGRTTAGRTMTQADAELFQSWLPTTSMEAPDYIPWPLLVLTASGQVTRSKIFGDFEMVLNRGFRWSFSHLPPLEETIHCEVADVRCRPSATRPGLNVVQFNVNVIATVSGDPIGSAEWVMMCQ
jgi:hypothetical protein